LSRKVYSDQYGFLTRDATQSAVVPHYVIYPSVC